jgi:SPFH domain/Band 7 family protein
VENRNPYLEQVVSQQAQLEQDLRPKALAPQSAAPRARELPAAAASAGVEVRVSGWWRWRTVLVPPNAYVVHTRRGRPEPLHIGQGTSFRYNPASDTFLAVPGAMQTIVINAHCICQELQGVLVQGYVQFIIQDFATAYRKLDFADPDDPMRLVNLQLREQAEAAIKDKVATMGIREVLSDKEPIIDELTARLRTVAEGTGSDDRGLGLRIVTVQIKEAVVSSAQLWENLQTPFRSEQGRIARLAQIEASAAISSRELAGEREIAELRAANEAAAFDREAAEALRRAEREQSDQRQIAEMENETALRVLALEHERDPAETEIGRLRLVRTNTLRALEVEGELAVERSRSDGAHARELLGLERDRMRAEIDNAQSPSAVQGKLIDALPEIVARLPKPAELRAVTIGGGDSTTVAGLLAELTAVVNALRAAANPRA